MVFKSGEYVLTNFETTNRYELKEILILEKFQPKKPLSVIHYYPSKKCYYVKRFLIETTTLDQKYSFIADETGAELTFVTLAKNPKVKYTLDLGKKQTSEEVVSLSELIDVKGWKAIGNKLVAGKIKEVVLIPSTENDEEDNDEPIDPNDSDPNNDPENGGVGDNSSDEVEESESKYNIELEITNFQQGEQGSLF